MWPKSQQQDRQRQLPARALLERGADGPRLPGDMGKIQVAFLQVRNESYRERVEWGSWDLGSDQCMQKCCRPETTS